jgi:hypothetical protein
MLGRRTAVRIPGPAPLDPPSAFGRMNSQRTSAGSIPQVRNCSTSGWMHMPEPVEMHNWFLSVLQ